MTEINNANRYLFRGKRIDNGEWVFGDYFNGYIVNYIDLATSWEPNTADHKLTVRAFAINMQTVGQLLRPENEEKFEDAYFEGDIVKHPVWGYLKATFDRENLEVVFEWPNGKSTYPVRMVKEYVLEVVGNVHDNPELLS